MNILIIQENGRHEENRNFRECFCIQRSFKNLGHNAEVWGLGHDNFDGPVKKLDKYDLIINLENYDTSGWVPKLDSVDDPIKFLWSIDPHCRGIEVYKKTFKDGNYNLILQAIKDHVDDNSVWFPNCYDDSLIQRREHIKKEKDIGFCGSLLNRAQILEFLSGRYGMEPDIWVLGDGMVDKINSYWIHFNINLANDINYRSFETIGCGTVLLTNRNYQYEELGFEDEKNCLMYDSIEELVSKLDLYHKNHDKLRNIGDNGFELAKKHTYDDRAGRIIKLYEDLRG